MGIIASEEIKKIIAEKKIDPDKNKLDEINSILKDYIISLMSPLEKSTFFCGNFCILAHGFVRRGRQTAEIKIKAL